MITLFKRGRVFWADASFGGIRQQWSLRTRDRAVAVELLRQAELDRLSGNAYKQKRWDDFQTEFLAWFKPQVAPHTYAEYVRVSRCFAAFLKDSGQLYLAECTDQLLARFTELRSSALHPAHRKPKTPGGVKFELRILRRMFSRAVDQDYLSRNPLRKRNLNGHGNKTAPFSQDEVSAMLASPYLAKRPYLLAIVQLFLHSGLRIGDVVHLQRASLAGDVLHRRTQKRGTTVRFPLHADVLAALELHRLALSDRQRASPYVFPTKAGQPIVGLDKYLRRLWDACGIRDAHAHRFRTTFAVNLLEHGASLYDVAKLLGISHRTAELHYTPYVKELQERAARLVSSVDYSAPKSLAAKL